VNRTGFASRYGDLSGIPRHLAGWFTLWARSPFLALLIRLRWALRRDRAQESRSPVKTLSRHRLAFNSTPLLFRWQWQTSSSTAALGPLDSREMSLLHFGALRVCPAATRTPMTGMDIHGPRVWPPPCDQPTSCGERKRLAGLRGIICRESTAASQEDDLLVPGRLSLQIPGVDTHARTVRVSTRPFEVYGGSPDITRSQI
jgi:hypothetical protein